MAGDWIKMRADLLGHPKVDNLAQLMGKDELFVVGALFAFWSWADKHSVDGRVDGATSRLVDRATRVDGIADALASVGWLVLDDAGITIPGYDEHNGESAKERSLKNQRQARWRERKSSGLVDAKPSTPASTPPSTREEKRREEKKEARLEVLPDWLPADRWADFVEHRKSIRAPMTDKARDRMLRHLAALHTKGIDVLTQMDTAIRSGWKDVYEPKLAGQFNSPSVPVPSKPGGGRREL